jgi:hypothetical protein
MKADCGMQIENHWPMFDQSAFRNLHSAIASRGLASRLWFCYGGRSSELNKA